MTYKISLAAVNVPEETYPMMEEALRAGKIGQTDLIEQFEQAIASFVGVKHCIAVSSGTMADAVAVAARKIELKRNGIDINSVLVPALTFIAQPNSVRYNNLDVHFADVNEDWTIDLVGTGDDDEELYFCTDLMGRHAPSGDIQDACESFGSKYKGFYSGTMAAMGTYSFFPSHTISTGEGGAIVTGSDDLADLCRSIRAHGSGSKDPMDKFHFPNFGFNARMTSLQAVLGISLMKHIDEYISRRRENFLHMRRLLGGFYEREGEEIIPHGYPIEFESEKARDTAMRNILDAGIECRKFFSCIPLEEPQYLREGSWPVASHIAHTHLYVPCHQNLTPSDVEVIAIWVKAQKGRVKRADPEGSPES